MKAEFNFSEKDERVELKSMRVIQNNKITSSPSCKYDIYVEIDYLNKEMKSKRSVSINVKNEKGVFVFSSGNQKSSNALIDSFYENGFDKGLYRTICKIPGNLLNPGIFTLDVFIIQSINDFIVAKSDILTFEVMEHSSWREDYLGDWIGVIRPKLEWKTEKIG